MALFLSEPDKNLPLLTQAFQVNADDVAEVRKFAVAYSEQWRTRPPDRLENPENLPFIRRGELPRLSGGTLFSETHFLADCRLYPDAAFQPLCRLIRVVQSMMRALEQGGKATETDMEAFQELLKTHPFYPKRFMQITETASGYTVGLREEEEYNPIEWFIREILKSMFSLFEFVERYKWQKAEGQEPADVLRRCEECGSVYLVRLRHPDQRFCSRRCQARTGERRRLQEKRAKVGAAN